MDEKIKQLHLNAGKICGEEHTCKGKINYKSEETALKAADSLNKSGKARHEVEPYPCVFCSGWHIGRKMSLKELEEIHKLYKGVEV